MMHDLKIYLSGEGCVESFPSLLDLLYCYRPRKTYIRMVQVKLEKNKNKNKNNDVAFSLL